MCCLVYNLEIFHRLSRSLQDSKRVKINKQTTHDLLFQHVASVFEEITLHERPKK